MKKKFIGVFFVTLISVILLQGIKIGPALAQESAPVPELGDTNKASDCNFTLSTETLIEPVKSYAQNENRLVDPNKDYLPETTLGNFLQRNDGVTISVAALTNDFQRWVARPFETLDGPYFRIRLIDLPFDTVRGQCRFAVWGKPERTEENAQDLNTYLNEMLSLEAWHQTYRGEGITVGVLDTCYDWYASIKDTGHFVSAPDVFAPVDRRSDQTDSAALPEDTSIVTPEPSPVATSEPTAEATLEAPLEATAEATGLATVEVPLEATEEILQTAEAESTLAVTPQGTAEATSDAELVGTPDAAPDAAATIEAEATDEASSAATFEPNQSGGCATGDENAYGHGTNVLRILHQIAPEATYHVVQFGGENTMPPTEQFTGAVDYLLSANPAVDIIVYAGSILDTNRQPYYAAVDRAIEKGILWVNAAGNVGAGYFFLEKTVQRVGGKSDRILYNDPNLSSGENLKTIRVPTTNDVVTLQAQFVDMPSTSKNVQLNMEVYDQLGTGIFTTVDRDQTFPRKFSVTAEQKGNIYSFRFEPDIAAQDSRLLATRENFRIGSGDGFLENYLGFHVDFTIGDETDDITRARENELLKDDTIVPIEVIVQNALPARYVPTDRVSSASYISVPADLPGVLTVGSYEPFLNELAWNSSRSNNRQVSVGIALERDGETIPLVGEPKPNIAGPNFIKLSAEVGDTFADTSAATPIVAGAAVLLLQRERELNNNAPALPRDLKSRIEGYGVCLNDAVLDHEIRRLTLPPPDALAGFTPPSCVLPPSWLTYPTMTIPTRLTIAEPDPGEVINEVLNIEFTVGDIEANGVIVELIENPGQPSIDNFVIHPDGSVEDRPGNYQPGQVCDSNKKWEPKNTVIPPINLKDDPDQYGRGTYEVRVVACQDDGRVVGVAARFEYDPDEKAILNAFPPIDVSADNETSFEISFSGVANGGIGYILDYQDPSGEWGLLPDSVEREAHEAFASLPDDYDQDMLCEWAEDNDALSDSLGREAQFFSLNLSDRFNRELNFKRFPGGVYLVRLTLCSRDGGDSEIHAIAKDPVESTKELTITYNPSIVLTFSDSNIGDGEIVDITGRAVGDDGIDYIIAYQEEEDTENRWHIANTSLSSLTLDEDEICDIFSPVAPSTPMATETVEPGLEPTQEATRAADSEAEAPLVPHDRIALPAYDNRLLTIEYDTSLANARPNFAGFLCRDGEKFAAAKSNIVTLPYNGKEERFTVQSQLLTPNSTTRYLTGTIEYGANFRYYVVRVRPQTQRGEGLWYQIVGPDLTNTDDVCAVENDPASPLYGMLGFPIDFEQGIKAQNALLAVIQTESLPFALEGSYEAEVTVCLEGGRGPNPEVVFFGLPGAIIDVEYVAPVMSLPAETLLREIPDEAAEGVTLSEPASVNILNITSDRSWLQLALADDSATIGWVQPTEIVMGAAPLPNPTPPPPSGGVAQRSYVFASDVTGTWHIYSASSTNGTQVQLTRGNNDNEYPSLSPNRTQIAFTSNRDGQYEIYLMQIDGSGLRRLTNDTANDYRPVWSPQGDTILFESDRESGIRKLFALAVATGVVTPVTTEGVGLPCCVSWSRDGRQIVYAASQAGQYDIYLANIEGSGVLKLTDSPANDINPSWQPGGNLIVFQSNREDLVNQLYRVNTDGSNLTRLTSTSGGNFDPSWAGGAQILFSTLRNGQLDIYVMNVDGSQQSRLFADPTPDDETSGEN